MRGLRIVIPIMRRRVVNLAHLGHLGLCKTKSLLRTKVCFTKMDALVEEMSFMQHNRARQMSTPPLNEWVTVWIKNGITILANILNSDLELLKKEEIEAKYNFRISNFLDYFQIQSVTNQFIKTNRNLSASPKQFTRPFIPHHISFLMKPNSSSKEIYNRLTLQRVDCNFKLKCNVLVYLVHLCIL